MIIFKKYMGLFILSIILNFLVNDIFGVMSTVMADTVGIIKPNDYRQHYFRDSETDNGYRGINNAMMHHVHLSFIGTDQSNNVKKDQSSKKTHLMNHLDVPHHFVSISNHDIQEEEPSPFSPRTLDRQLYSNVVSSRNYISCTKLSMAATFILGVAMF